MPELNFPFNLSLYHGKLVKEKLTLIMRLGRTRRSLGTKSARWLVTKVIRDGRGSLGVGGGRLLLRGRAWVEPRKVC